MYTQAWAKTHNKYKHKHRSAMAAMIARTKFPRFCAGQKIGLKTLEFGIT
jgi:hypothetical protein